MNYSLNNEAIEGFNDSPEFKFPKYTTQLINLANGNAGGTRPAVVGQMSELFPEYVASADEVTIAGWKEWYIQSHPQALDKAVTKIHDQVENLRKALPLIDDQMIRNWTEDLLINKTFNGMYVQKAILASLAKLKGTTYRLANPDEEAQGIDGYVGSKAYSVKPDTYKTMGRLSERIDVTMIYYTKTKTGLKIEVEE